MRREFTIAIVVLFGFLSFLWIEKPFRGFLSDHLFEEQIADYASGITVRSLLIIVALALISRFRFAAFTGLSNWKKVKNIQAVYVASAFILMGVVQNWHIYLHIQVGLLILFGISTIAVGLVEELAFRGVVFPLFIKSFEGVKRPLLLSAVLSSLIFGSVHYINLLSQPENILGITSQVFFATAIGVFFCGLMVRTENILLPCLIHALINFGFSAGELIQPIEEMSSSDETVSIDWASVLPTSALFVFIFIGGVYMINKADREVVISKLGIGQR